MLMEQRGRLEKALTECLRRAREAILNGLKKPNANKVLAIRMGDKTKLIDKEAEDVIINSLRKYFDNFTVLSEELGRATFGNGRGPIFIIDPLDGSTNALRGYPIFSVSIAVSEGNSFSKIYSGAVMNVVTGDVFLAFKGRGVLYNNKKVKPNDIRRISNALVGVDLNIRSRIPNYLKKLERVIESARHVRSLGTNALETCFVSAGICDAFIELRGILRLTDFAAACFIVKEAGGVVLDERGAPFDLDFYENVRGKYIAACTKDLAMDILINLK